MIDQGTENRGSPTEATARRGSARWPWVVWALMMCGLIGAVTLSVLNDAFETFVVIAIFMMLGYGTIGAFVSSRVPGNPLGWLMLTVGAAFAVTGLSDEYLVYAVVTDPGGLPAPGVAAWLNGWTFLVAFVPVPLLLLLYPTGKTLSSRWTWVARVIVGAATVTVITFILSPGNIDSEGDVRFDNPTGLEGAGAVLDVISLAALLVILVCTLASVAGLVARYRKAVDEERRQIRALAWLASAAVLLALIALATASIPWLSELFFIVFFACIGIAFPAAIGYAILRYRLYDLDLVIKKTVTYSLIAVALTGLYLALVAVATLGNVSRALFGVVVLALTFGPVRRAARSLADRVVYGRRASPYEVLSEFAERMSETYSTEDVLPRTAQVLQAATGATRADVWLRVGREFRASASFPDDLPPQRAVPAHEGAEPDLPGDFTAEVRHHGELLGALAVSMPANDPLDPSRERLIRDLAAQAGPVLRNVRLIAELRASRQRLVAAQDEERRKLERNIHDGAQQQLVALSVKTRLVDSMVDRDPSKAHEMLDQIQSETNETLETLRDLARGIYPPLLADKGLATALQAQGRKAAIPVSVTTDGVGRYRAEVEATVYFCVLEALNNVAKYAEAEQIEIALATTGGALRFEVRDDGTGFDPDRPNDGTGIQGMKDRIDATGGTLRVSSAPGEGTVVTGTVPIDPT